MSGETRLIVEVVPDVTGIDRTFDYFVPHALLDDPLADVGIGSRVRVDLNGRRIAGWIVSTKPDSKAGEELKPVLKCSGIGPDEAMVELCRWAARRWCVSRLRPFLVTASPQSVVRRAAPKLRTKVVATPRSPAATDLLDGGGGVLRLPPTLDQIPTILSAASLGPTLVVCASVDTSRVMAARLKRSGLSVALMPHDWAGARGGVDVTIGARSAAFAPCPEMASAVLLDEHEESLREERMPTWHAREVLEERCRRAAVPFLLVSACPTAVGAHGRRVLAPSVQREHDAWPYVQVVDRGDQPPWNRSLLSSEVIELARRPTLRMVCVVNTKGHAKLLGCKGCGSLVCCDSCDATMVELEEGRLDCSMCGISRPRICSKCTSTSIVRLRPGVARLREELERAANRPVGELETGDDVVDDSKHDLFIGTNASLLRLRHIEVVAFLDFDRELLAPRFPAHEQAMALLVRAARLVGPRNRGGRIVLQTSLVEDEVVRAARSGLGGILTDAETARRELLDLPPFSALAVVDGEGVEECRQALVDVSGVEVSLHRNRLLVRARNHESLSAVWAGLPARLRSSVRIEVDPVSV